MEVTVPDGCIPGDTMAVQSASRWQLDGCTSGMWSIHTVNPRTVKGVARSHAGSAPGSIGLISS